VAGGANHTLIQPTSGNWDFVFPTAIMANLTTNSTIHLLFEGCTEGNGTLNIVLLQNNSGTYTKLGSGPGVSLQLQDIKEMYERWTVGDADGLSSSVYPGSNDGASDAGNLVLDSNGNATISTARLPSWVSAGAQWTTANPSDSTQNTYILFVHGWNMQGWEKDAFAETAFKRLYWQGYQGRFGAFQWPTTFLGTWYTTLATSYDDGEYAAWMSAPPLRNLLKSLSGIYGGNVYVVAHSMGNAVTGEALRLAGQAGTGQLVASYVATQAAIAGSMWDGNLTSNAPLTFGAYGPDTPNIYDNWFSNATTSAVGSKYSFFNLNDWALNGDHWQFDQVSKPDIRDLGTLVYYYGSSNLTVVADLFEKAPCISYTAGELIMTAHTGIDPTSLYLGNSTAINNQYEIMAYDSEPRSLRLGNITTFVEGFSSQQLPNATSGGVWPPDNLSSAHDYSEHPWHSAQFMFDNVSQNKYWNALLNDFGLLLNNE
jgi:pimeloyl-ACP methyl ester carboxylesterase